LAGGFMLFFLVTFVSYSQHFNLNVPNKCFMAEPGTGIDTKIKVIFHDFPTYPVYLSVIAPDGIEAVLQPGNITRTDTVILSMFVSENALAELTVPVYISATDNYYTESDTISLQVTGGSGAYLDDYLARTYRDSAIGFIQSKYPELVNDFGNLLDYEWIGFYPYPPLDIVSHYVYLNNNWRINVLWHVMVPPHDWKKVFIYNEAEKTGWGVNIDTDGICSEIACSKYYYFYQDTNNLISGINSNACIYEAVSFPNPFSEKTTIMFSNQRHLPFTFQMFDAGGCEIRRFRNIRKESIEIFREQLTPGIYYYRLTGNKIYHGKIILL